ncbi:MAG: phospholipid carrier-dependent glycosyltransferase, partial [Anaerolineae bacterium]|nr:phospholipid carrier-dependent glycosyltransferase [Anaerolineae bacterium]
MKRIRLQAAILSLILVFFALGMQNVRGASLTFDEGPHLAVGYATLKSGDFRLQPIHIHPPLANYLSAIPLLLQNDLPDPTQIDGWESNSLSAVTDTLVWRYPNPATIATAARTPILLLGVLLAALTFRWADALGGLCTGLFSLFLLALDPNMIAHSSLVTTDLAVTFFVTASLYLANRFLFLSEETSNQFLNIILCGACVGLAMLSKVSAILLIPVISILVVYHE